jgi:hypothetical protein
MGGPKMDFMNNATFETTHQVWMENFQGCFRPKPGDINKQKDKVKNSEKRES